MTVFLSFRLCLQQEPVFGIFQCFPMFSIFQCLEWENLGELWGEEKARAACLASMLCANKRCHARDKTGQNWVWKSLLFFRHFLPLCTKCQTNDYNLYQAMIDQILLNALTKHPKTKWAMSESELLWHIWYICDHMAQTSYFVICHNMITENGDNHWCCCKRRKWCLGWFWPCWCVLTIAQSH